MAHRDDLDPDTTNRLLTGRLGPDDAPPRFREVAVLLQAAHAAAAPSAVGDEALIGAMVDAILTPEVAAPRRKRVLICPATIAPVEAAPIRRPGR